MDSCDVHIVVHSEVKLFTITEGVFLYVGDVLIEVLNGMELNDLLHCGTEGRYDTDWLDTGSLELDRNGQLERMKPWLVERILGWSIETLETCWTCLFSLLSPFAPHRGGV